MHADAAQRGAHDERETTASFWATPSDVLSRFDRGEVQLAPPTHRTLAVLAELSSADGLERLSQSACFDPICPRLVSQREGTVDLLALALPGDPEHEIATPRTPGPSRFVLRGTQWKAESAPTALAGKPPPR